MQWVSDGATALVTVQEFRPRVVLLDRGLPGMDGYEVARQLRTRQNGLRLVALTASGRDEYRTLSKQSGFDTHVVKPVDPEELERVISLLEGGAPENLAPRPRST